MRGVRVVSETEKKIIKNPIKAIRAKCLECSGGSATEVKECPIKGCALYEFRFGRNPYRKPISDEHREMLRQRALANFCSRNIEVENEERALGDDGTGRAESEE